MSTLSVRIDKDLEAKLDLILKEKKISDKSAYIRQLLTKGLQDDLLAHYLDQVEARKLSLWKVAQLMNISLHKIMEMAAKRKIFSYEDKDFEHDLDLLYKEDSN